MMLSKHMKATLRGKASSALCACHVTSPTAEAEGHVNLKALNALHAEVRDAGRYQDVKRVAIITAIIFNKGFAVVK